MRISNSPALALCDFMMVKEEKKSNGNPKKDILSSNSSTLSTDTDSLSSNFSNKSQYQNLGIETNDVSSRKDDEDAFIHKRPIEPQLNSCNRKRRKSFLTGNTNSPFGNSPFLPARSKLETKCHNTKKVSNTPATDSHKKIKPLATHDKEMISQINISSRENVPQNANEITRIPSKGSDMSLTMVASPEEIDSDNMFTQALTQQNLIPHHKEDMKEIETQDSDNMFTQALTQRKEIPHQKDDSNEIEMQDSDNMFTEAFTQATNKISKDDSNISEEDSDHMFSQFESQALPELNPNSKDLASNKVAKADIPVNTSDGIECEGKKEQSRQIMPIKHDLSLEAGIINRNILIQGETENIADSGNSLESILVPNNESNKIMYQQPSFQNFSSDSAKAALNRLAAGLSINVDSINQPSEPVTSRCQIEDKKEQEMVSIASSSDVAEENALEFNEEEELAVSIMTQAFSEVLSEGGDGMSLNVHASNLNADGEENEDLPATQPSLLFMLEGVVAYVEVRTANENRSACVKNRLQSIGAKISEHLNLSCTHLVFKDGSLTTYNKAKKIGLHIVSVSWIEACRNEGIRLPEANYPCSNQERYESPGLFPKLRKAKSMQPKADEEFLRALNMKIHRKEKAKQRTDKKAEAARKAEKERLYNPFTYKVRHPLPDHYYNSPTLEADLDSNEKKSHKKRYDVLEMLEECGSYIAAQNTMSPQPPCNVSPRVPGKGNAEFLSPDKRLIMTGSKNLESNEKLPGVEIPSPCTSDDLNTPFVKRLADRINRRNSLNHSPRLTPYRINRTIDSSSKSPMSTKYRNNDDDNASKRKRSETDGLCKTVSTKAAPDLDASYNPSPIARKSFFDAIVDASEVKISVENKINECKNVPIIDPTKTSNDPISKNDTIDTPILVVRTRSSIKEKPLTVSSKAKTTVDKIAKQKNTAKSNKKGVSKKRHILFSDPTSLLSETPTGSPANLEIQMPSTLKAKQFSDTKKAKVRKSVAPQIVPKTTTKIVRSESGSVLYAQPPKSTAANRRESRRLKIKNGHSKTTQHVKGNPDGSYESHDADFPENQYLNGIDSPKFQIKRTIAPPRRSTADFESPMGVVTRKMSTKFSILPLNEEIVCTSCDKEDVHLAQLLSKQFGPVEKSSSQSSTGSDSQSSNSSRNPSKRSKIKHRTFNVALGGKVTCSTTHVICGYSNGDGRDSQLSVKSQEPTQPVIRRTMNVLRGILRGCWILSKNWLYDSLELGSWANEEIYEAVDFSSAVRSSRIAREAFSSPAYGLKFCSVSYQRFCI